MTLYLQKLGLFVCRDKFFLNCYIQLNQLWVLIRCSLISGYFHDFTEERTIMLKVFPDDDLGSTTHDRKKEQEKGIHMTPTAMMSSISMLALLERGNVFVLGADTSRVRIDITLMQDGPWHERGIKITVDPPATTSYAPPSLCVRVARSDWRSFTVEIHHVNTAREEDA
ncbi:hypothetical protein B296_00027919 [Ensete ventricosum]|uniref:Uncharacterized protein n=1 Tax=Ensete ventricosum TaxID=4639 RepID=A0A426XHX7_ENSVE|nr:hypothetical protein B296_00027919 [Ensete ventricosum]